ncbi:hypothetical protein Htur_4976 (plasmid) [Haloterrigena turkmenica DSM 5511]|uniref:Uncharacterized protein n=1 Tax=Haloterrigena turkmenica (strain ATCC 51198 / DSM 5511 / JCM 9101 / NCIMB 13204 / VKM B-1734 / 4k) TaxID=543526 RepID=D2S2W2_HALTV|nr:hypothetical protein Htur_4976 [Haloterrigena turkmenica DSM 5511]
MSPPSANTGRDASIDGKENGVQFPIEKARSNTVPRFLTDSSTGVCRSSS